MAHEEYIEEVVVKGRRLVLAGHARSASEGIIGQQDLEIRPLLRPGDVLESIPGMIVTQHSGSGKSNQMFLRGFNLDHGTDFATWIDDMPVNMRSHGHGQGYTDINFLIPETVRAVEFVKGPYHAELGDFSSAGGAHIRLFDKLPGNQVKLGFGENGYQRLLAMGVLETKPGALSGALEVQAYDGPWKDVDEDVEKINGVLRYSSGAGPRSWRVTGMYYDNEWNSADQIPTRAVDQGMIDELGSIDTTLGGESTRASLSAGISWDSAEGGTDLSVYFIDYDLKLWSNFTYLLDNPDTGDQFQQVDDRKIFGAGWRKNWEVTSSVGEIRQMMGAEFRYDDIDEVGLFKTRDRQRLETTRSDSVDVMSIGVFYELEWQMTQRWRSVLGLRGDYYDFDDSADDPANSGVENDSIVSPKASLIYGVNETTEVYLSGGFGFHSNDARGTTITIDPLSGEPVDQVDPLVESRGAEIGFKSLVRERWNTSLSLWYLDLDSELLFVGDAGSTEASRSSERWGVEFNNFFEINDIWSLEADFSWTDASFSNETLEGDEIPGALEWVMSGAVSAQYPNGWFGTFRVRYFDDAPLTEDGKVTSAGSTIAHSSLGWSDDRWRFQLDLLNLFDSEDHDIDYFYASRLPGEGEQGVEDVHYHVFEPRQLRVYLGLRF
jgi:hypothetical protein